MERGNNHRKITKWSLDLTVKLDYLSFINNAMREPQQMSTFIKYGFYSASAAKQCNTFEFTNVSGENVKFTAAMTTPDGADYFWPDKVAVGPIPDEVRLANEIVAEQYK